LQTILLFLYQLFYI
jgi:hypothetical protein